MKRAKLKIYYGPMFSGKSANLIKDILENISTPKLVFKPKGDIRSEKVYTREGLEFEAIPVSSPSDILKHTNVDWLEKIYIDEINFFDKSLVSVVRSILDKGIDVVCSGLDTDYRTNPFPASEEIIEMSDIAVRIKAKCHICGAPSAWTSRFVNGEPDSIDSPTIIPDSSDTSVEYKTLCTKCHPFLRGEK